MIRSTVRTVIPIVLVLLSMAVMPALARQAAPIQGQLVKVDTDAKTLDVKTANGMQVQFKYTDETVVEGAQNGVAGLAASKDTNVSVTYKEDGQIKTATRIQIQQPKK